MLKQESGSIFNDQQNDVEENLAPTVDPPEVRLHGTFRTEQRSCVEATAEPTEDQCISHTAFSLHKHWRTFSHAKSNNQQTARFFYAALKSKICLNTVRDA